MKINEYFKLLLEGKEQEAEKVRISTIPNKLIKFIWLDESEKDDLKFLTLKNDEIWFAHKKSLNDPYEYKGMLIDKEKFIEAGYPIETIEKYLTIFNFLLIYNRVVDKSFIYGYI